MDHYEPFNWLCPINFDLFSSVFLLGTLFGNWGFDENPLWFDWSWDEAIILNGDDLFESAVWIIGKRRLQLRIQSILLIHRHRRLYKSARQEFPLWLLWLSLAQCDDESNIHRLPRLATQRFNKQSPIVDNGIPSPRFKRRTWTTFRADESSFRVFNGNFSFGLKFDWNHILFNNKKSFVLFPFEFDSVFGKFRNFFCDKSKHNFRVIFESLRERKRQEAVNLINPRCAGQKKSGCREPFPLNDDGGNGWWSASLREMTVTPSGPCCPHTHTHCPSDKLSKGQRVSFPQSHVDCWLNSISPITRAQDSGDGGEHASKIKLNLGGKLMFVFRLFFWFSGSNPVDYWTISAGSPGSPCYTDNPCVVHWCVSPLVVADPDPG